MSRLNFRGHIGKRDYAANTVAPTVSGSAINGQTLTGANGTWTSAESLITGYAYQWQTADAPSFTQWADLAGANAITLVLAAGQISKKVRLGVAAVNGDGQAPYTFTLPTAIVQDAPAIPLTINGTPNTTAAQGSSSTFIVSFDGGNGAYTPSLINAPSGSTITLTGTGDQAAVSLSTASAGSFAGIIVEVTDETSTADLPSFSFTVNSISGLQTVIPGSGWTGTTTTVNGVDATVNRGSSSGRGYGYKPSYCIDHPNFTTLSTATTIWIHGYHTGDASVAASDKRPTFGMDKVSVAADGGAWIDIFPTWNPVGNYWGFPFVLDPSKWTDGTWTTALRTIRVALWPRNGIPQILQSEPTSTAFNDDVCLKFSTNAGGTLPATIKYVSGSGNDTTGDGSSGNPYRTLSKAITAISTAQGGDVGGGRIKCKAGTYNFSHTGAATAKRHLVIEADTGVSPTSIQINGQGSRGLSTPFVHIRNLSQSLNLLGPGMLLSSLYAENIVSDRGSLEWATVDNGTPWNLPFVAAGRGSAGFWQAVYVIGGTTNNYFYGNCGARLVRDHATLTIGSDTHRETRAVINCTYDKILAGAWYNAPPSQGGTTSGGIHPDCDQNLPGGSSGTISNLIRVNVSMLTGNCDAQGPFLGKNAGLAVNPQTTRGIFLINYKVLQKNSGRAAFQMGTDMNVQNCMLWDVRVKPASGGSVICSVGPGSEDAILVGIDFPSSSFSGWTNYGALPT